MELTDLINTGYLSGISTGYWKAVKTKVNTKLRDLIMKVSAVQLPGIYKIKIVIRGLQLVII